MGLKGRYNGNDRYMFISHVYGSAKDGWTGIVECKESREHTQTLDRFPIHVPYTENADPYELLYTGLAASSFISHVENELPSPKQTKVKEAKKSKK